MSDFCAATACLSSSDGCTFDILVKVPSETLLNMAAVIDHQFKKHTVHPKGNSRSTFSELPIS